MIDRRTLLGLTLALPFMTGAARGSRAASTEAARREFLKILALFNAEDVAGFLAYGPPLLIDDKKPVERDALPAFFQSLHTSGGKPDEKPPWLAPKDFGHKARPAPRWIFGAAVSRSVWSDAWIDDSAHDGHMNALPLQHDAGYSPAFEEWNVFFDGERIYRLERWIEIS